MNVDLELSRVNSVKVIVARAENATTWAVHLHDDFGVATDWDFRSRPEPDEMRTIIWRHVRLSMGLTKRN
jgi:hypothetical protein